MNRLFLTIVLLAFSTPAGAAEKILYSAPDPLGVVTITENQHEARRTVAIDGQPVAWTGDGSDRRALTPYLLLEKAPVAVAQIGLTNGASAGAAVRMGAGRVTVVEPNKALVKGLLAHAPALSLQGVTTTIATLDHWLNAGDETFDLISIHPHAIGDTVDPFKRMTKKLAPGGRVALCAPLGGYDREGFVRLLTRFKTAFPHVTLWFDNLIPARGYLLFIGSLTPQRLDLPIVRRHLADLKGKHYFIEGEDGASLLTFYLANERGLASVTGKGPLKPFLPPYSDAGFLRSKALFRWLADQRTPLSSNLNIDRETKDRLDRYFACRTEMIKAALIGVDGTTADKIAHLDKARTFHADDPHLALAYYRLGMTYFRSNLFLEAASLLEKAKAIAPDLPPVRYSLGQSYEKMMRYGEASKEFEALEKLAPGFREQIRIKAPPQASKEGNNAHKP